MKKLKFLYLMLAVIAGSIAFASCNSDDEPEKPVYVFNPDNAHYIGTTKTTITMGLQDMLYTTDKTHWTIVIDRNTNKAKVTIHNAKFNDRMPAMSMMVLDNLTYNPQADIVSGTDIIPRVLEGDSFTPYEDFPFDKITVTYGNTAHSSVNINFDVQVSMGGGSSATPPLPGMPGGNSLLGRGTFTGTGYVGPCPDCN